MISLRMAAVSGNKQVFCTAYDNENLQTIRAIERNYWNYALADKVEESAMRAPQHRAGICCSTTQNELPRRTSLLVEFLVEDLEIPVIVFGKVNLAFTIPIILCG
ncbi:hypothetical protein ACH5RR_020330 [Cinchona calisaya]|uniref:Uncharacterized protein n=1 Tax=Cinchona calisaya TaxID=153742 RepID=A0ABD2ZE71_9GENT